MTDYPDKMLVKDALAIFYEQNKLGPDGNVKADWIALKLGKLRIPFPNSTGRKEAVKYHDIHHILASYPTTWKGEAALGAWEVSTGCGQYRAAWIFDLGIFALGLFIFPKTVFNAFVRGRRSFSFYNNANDYEHILTMTVAEARAVLQLRESDNEPVSLKQLLEFTAWWLIAFLISFLIFIAPVAFIIHLIVD